MSVPGWQRARVEELPVLLEARAGLPQEVVLHGRRQEPLEAVDVTRGRAHPVPEDRQEGGILEDGVPPLHAPKGGDVLEQADLDADRRDPLSTRLRCASVSCRVTTTFQPTRAPTTRRRPPSAKPS